MKNFVYEFRTRRIRRSRAAEGLGAKVCTPENIATIARHITRGEARELFLAFFLDGQNRIVGYETIAIGCLTGVDVHPREVFRTAIIAPAAAIVLAHNHPSGDPKPSIDDQTLTDRMQKAGELLGIPVIDHVVVTEERYFSIVEERSR